MSIPHFMVLMVSLALSACQSTSHYSSSLELSAKDSCEEAAIDAHRAWGEELMGKDDSVIKTSLSYLATGAGYGLDSVSMISSGIIFFGLFCAPAIAVQASLPVPSTAAFTVAPRTLVSCLTDNLYYYDPELRKTVEKYDKDSIVNDVQYFNQAMRKIASCYEGRGDEENLIKAYLQLEQLQKMELFSMLPLSERSNIKGDRARVEKKLLTLSSEFLKDVQKKKVEIENNAKSENEMIVAILKAQTTKNKTWTQADGIEWYLAEIEIPTAETAKSACENLDAKHKWRLPNFRAVIKAQRLDLLKTKRPSRVWVSDDEGMLQFDLKDQRYAKPINDKAAFLLCTRL